MWILFLNMFTKFTFKRNFKHVFYLITHYSLISHVLKIKYTLTNNYTCMVINQKYSANPFSHLKSCFNKLPSQVLPKILS